ncbi:hypothetical protein BKA81DRAFT_381049 [Phyllosticta paracitricarpa]
MADCSGAAAAAVVSSYLPRCAISLNAKHGQRMHSPQVMPVQRDAAITDSALNEVDKLVRSLIHPENFSLMASVLPVPTYKLPEMSNGRNTDPARLLSPSPDIRFASNTLALTRRIYARLPLFPLSGSPRSWFRTSAPFFWDISALPSNPTLHLVLISPSAPTPDYRCGRSRTSFDGVSDGLVAPTSAHWLDTRCRPYPGGCLLGVLAREPGRPFCEDEGYDILVATIALSSNVGTPFNISSLC